MGPKGVVFKVRGHAGGCEILNTFPEPNSWIGGSIQLGPKFIEKQHPKRHPYMVTLIRSLPLMWIGPNILPTIF